MHKPSESLAELRKEALREAGVVNLNAGTCSPTTRGVLQKVLAWQEREARDPVEALFRAGPSALEEGRVALASLLGCEARDLVLTTNSTYAAAVVLDTFPWKSGDEVVVSDQEYHHYYSMLRRLEETVGIKARRFRIPQANDRGQEDSESVRANFRDACSPRTRALLVSHVSSCTGTIIPVQELCADARSRGIVSIVDGAHAPGLVPLDLTAIDADYYFGNVHKWLMGAATAAFLVVRHASRASIRPLVTMDPAYYAAGDAERRYRSGATRFVLSFEYQGTRSLAPFVTLPDVVAFQRRLPADAQDDAWRLAQRVRRALAPLGYRAVTPDDRTRAASMTAFRLPEGTGPVDLDLAWRTFRKDHGLEVAVPPSPEKHPLLRISTAWWNTDEDVDRLLAVLPKFDWSKVAPP